MKKIIAVFTTVMVLAFAGGVFAQTNTLTPSASPTPTTTQPAGAPSTGFGGSG